MKKNNQYYIYIDESGSFDEGLSRLAGKNRKPSIVCGICTTLSPQEWEIKHKAVTKKINEQNNTSFSFPDHFHCGEILANKIRNCNYSRNIREGFIEAVRKVVDDNIVLIITSKNSGCEFSYSPQACYVQNLNNVLITALEEIAIKLPELTSLSITIAQRTISETSSHNYTKYLLDYVKKQLLVGNSKGSKLARKLDSTKKLKIKKGVGTRDPGLIAADFVACLKRNKTDFVTKTLTNKISKPLPDDYNAFYQKELMKFLDSKQYATCMEFLQQFFPLSNQLPDFSPVFAKLRSEKDNLILSRELSALLAKAHYFIENRTTEKNSLNIAKKILDNLIKIAQEKIDSSLSNNIKKTWVDLLINAYCDLEACYNHIGATSQQVEIEKLLNTTIKKYGKLISKSYHEKKELLLQSRIKNLNILFNDYRFGEVIDVFQKEVDKRENEIPESETDELLGQMLGSLGQACAFKSKIDSSWADIARDYFNKSILHFESGTIFHQMSVNFLTILSWQENNIEQAIKEMNKHPHLLTADNITSLLDKFVEYITQDNVSLFDIVIYLRLAATAVENGYSIETNTLKTITDNIIEKLIPEHPHEHIYKWLAYLYYLSGDYYFAVNLCQKGVETAKTLDFTVQTIGISILGMEAICYAAMDNEKQYATCFNEFRKWIAKLINESVAFADYIDQLGGVEKLEDMIKRRNKEGFYEIARFLPFAYA